MSDDTKALGLYKPTIGEIETVCIKKNSGTGRSLTFAPGTPHDFFQLCRQIAFPYFLLNFAMLTTFSL